MTSPRRQLNSAGPWHPSERGGGRSNREENTRFGSILLFFWRTRSFIASLSVKRAVV